MFILTSKNSAEQGAYAVENQDKENVLFFFEEEDDAERYALMLEADEDRSLTVMEIEEGLAFRTCKLYNYRYAVIKPEDIVIPPKLNDNVSKD
tara:strand:+ start:1199 stop:1477 length:279 start_codon:yes stop_codon:yes gene_type:complete